MLTFALLWNKISSLLTIKNILIIVGVIVISYGEYRLYAHGKSSQLQVDQPKIDALNKTINDQITANAIALAQDQKKIADTNLQYQTQINQQKAIADAKIKSITDHSNDYIANVLQFGTYKPDLSESTVTRTNSTGTQTVADGCYTNPVLCGYVKNVIGYSVKADTINTGYAECYADYQIVKKGLDDLRAQAEAAGIDVQIK